MNGNDALRRLEQKFLPLRTIGAAATLLEAYQRDMLPDGPVPPLLEQGFVAGFDAAWKSVREALAEAQTEALRAPRLDPAILKQALNNLRTNVGHGTYPERLADEIARLAP